MANLAAVLKDCRTMIYYLDLSSNPRIEPPELDIPSFLSNVASLVVNCGRCLLYVGFDNQKLSDIR